jgi:hypothetical protein
MNGKKYETTDELTIMKGKLINLDDEMKNILYEKYGNKLSDFHFLVVP